MEAGPLLVCLLFVLASTGISQQIIYVDSSATGLNNDSSWANAYKSFDSAFNRNNQLGYDDTIRVAKGTYRPSLATTKGCYRYR